MNWWDFLFTVGKTFKAFCEILLAAVVIHTGFAEIRKLLSMA